MKAVTSDLLYLLLFDPLHFVAIIWLIVSAASWRDDGVVSPGVPVQSCVSHLQQWGTAARPPPAALHSHVYSKQKRLANLLKSINIIYNILIS